MIIETEMNEMNFNSDCGGNDFLAMENSKGKRKTKRKLLSNVASMVLCLNKHSRKTWNQI